MTVVSSVLTSTFRTDVHHIYAAGDAVGFPALASTSMQQGRLAMKHAFGSDVSSTAFRLLPTGIYTIPEVGMVGDTEESLKAKGSSIMSLGLAHIMQIRGAGSWATTADF